ncbi:diguanylate cyclase [Celerinatantimonas sp. MCCC 1A17872]|uniref:GGDEF domain-containing protein n=1 Tax=Celerinatantimonas sp. MCCC 1A17872 TaxID=3177514 RepID=UPI0038C83087
MIQHASHLSPYIRKVIIGFFTFVFLTGSLLVLLGWEIQSITLTQLMPVFPSMKPNTAIGFFLCGCALFSIYKRFYYPVYIIGGILIALFSATAIEYAFTINLHIDQLLFTDKWSNQYPGRPSIATSVSFIFAGLFTVLYPRWQKRAVYLDIVCVIGLASPTIALLGYIYNPLGLFKVPVFSSMAFHTCIAFIMFFIAAPVLNQRSHINALLFVDAPGSRLFKRLILPIFAMPLLLGLIYKTLVVNKLLEPDFALALFAASFIIVSLAALIHNSVRYNALFAEFNAISTDNLHKQLKLSVILDSSSGALILFSEKGVILSVNRGATNILGWTQEEMEQMSVWEIVPFRYRITILRAVANFRRQSNETRESLSLWLFAKCKNAEELAVLVSVTQNTYRNQLIYGALVLDAQRLIDHIQRLNRDINLDQLTQAHNRRALEHEMQTLRENLTDAQLKLAIAIIDIDHFKAINDQYGHRAGDLALQTFARRIINCLRVHDRLYRFGGDEFVVIAEVANELELRAIFERVRVAIAATPVSYENMHFNLTCSIGVCSMATGEGNIDRCFSNADQALYQSKQRGRNRLEIYKSSQSIRTPSHTNLSTHD